MKMDKIIQHIKDGQHLLIASHAEPDGDAVGSLLALGLALYGNLGVAHYRDLLGGYSTRR